jgi:hypothetical protein
MKKAILLLFIVCCCHLGWAQKKTVTEEKYSLVRTNDVVTYYEGLLITPFLCDYQALTTEPVEKTMTFDDVNIFDYAMTDRKTVASVYVDRVRNAIIKEKGATAIIACMHDVESLKNGAIKVTVSGIPVKYTNFRPATEKDLWMSQFYKNTDIPAQKGVVNIRVNTEQK